MEHIKQIFWRGLTTLLPVAITVAILYWLGVSFERTLGALVALALPEGFYVPGMGLLLAIVLVFAIGAFMRAWLVRKLLGFGESLIERVPFAKTVYGGVRDVIRYVELAGAGDGMGDLVAFDIAEGRRVLGFVTGDAPPFADGADRVAVFIPMSYSIGGYTVCVERSAVESVDLSAEDAWRWVLTAGVSGAKRGPG